MFKSLVRGALVAATVAAGFGAAPASAASLSIAADRDVGFETVQYRDDFRRGEFRGDECRPRLALRKAFDIGLNRPRIVRENRRVVVVDGFRRGRPATVRFANDRGCPVLDVRR